MRVVTDDITVYQLERQVFVIGGFWVLDVLNVEYIIGCFPPVCDNPLPGFTAKCEARRPEDEWLTSMYGDQEIVNNFFTA